MAPGYVRSLFDQYASNFDRALVEGLGYRGPALLRDALSAAVAARRRPFHVARAIDLGCGTGLVAEALHAHCGTIVGVDLSPAMAAAARRDRKSTRLNSSHVAISYAVFCLKKKKRHT